MKSLSVSLWLFKISLCVHKEKIVGSSEHEKLIFLPGLRKKKVWIVVLVRKLRGRGGEEKGKWVECEMKANPGCGFY